MTTFLFTLLLFFLLLAATLLVGLASLWLRARKRNRIAGVLRQFNENQDRSILVQFVSSSPHYYLDLLEYLENAEAYELAAELVQSHPLPPEASRHLRVVAARLLVKQGQFPAALDLIEALAIQFPNDPSVLEQAIHIAFLADQVDKARIWFETFQHQANKGQRVKFFQALFLAAEGQGPQALLHLEKIRDAERTLANNTLAPLTKQQIQEQVKQTEYWIGRLSASEPD